MKPFRQYIQESLSSSYPIIDTDKQIGSDGDRSYKKYVFQPDGSRETYQIRLYYMYGSVEVEFRRGAFDFDLVGGTSATVSLRIFATVASVLKQFLKEHTEITEIYFSSYDKRTVRLYTRFGHMIAKELKWEVDEPDFSHRMPVVSIYKPHS